LTRLRLPIVGRGAPPEPPACFEPLPREALLVPPCPLVVVAGERLPRAKFVGSLVRSFDARGLHAATWTEPLEGVSRDDLVASLASHAAGPSVLVVEGGAALGLYRATLAVLVGVRASSSAALRAHRDRVDLDVEFPGDALAALLATRLAARLLTPD
jgi:hypothetical protein